jgi:hypothetical protein
MKIKKILLGVLLLGSVRFSQSMWPLPEVLLKDATIGILSGLIILYALDRYTETEPTAPPIQSPKDTQYATQTTISPSYAGFARYPEEIGQPFKESETTHQIGALKFNPLYYNNIFVNEDKSINVRQVQTETQTLNTCLFHSLKNAVLLRSQILKAQFPVDRWKILTDITKSKENEWQEAWQLDDFLKLNQKHTDDAKSALIEFDVTAVSKDKHMLLYNDIAPDIQTHPHTISCATKLKLCLEEAALIDTPQEDQHYFHALLILTTNAAVTKACDYAHWYCLLVHQDGYGNRDYIIADSLNGNRTNTQSVVDIIQEIESKFS